MGDESLDQEIERTVDSTIPADITERIDRMVAELRERDAVPGIGVGEKAPDFTLPDAHGNPVTLSDRLGKGPVVLSFYRLDQEVADAYRVRFPLGDSLREIYEQWLPMPEHNADGSWNLPVPATFIIDTDGVVRARHVDADYRHRMEPEDIVEALRQLT